MSLNHVERAAVQTELLANRRFLHALYSMLRGHRPPAGMSDTEVIAAVAEGIDHRGPEPVDRNPGSGIRFGHSG